MRVVVLAVNEASPSPEFVMLMSNRFSTLNAICLSSSELGEGTKMHHLLYDPTLFMTPPPPLKFNL